MTAAASRPAADRAASQRAVPDMAAAEAAAAEAAAAEAAEADVTLTREATRDLNCSAVIAPREAASISAFFAFSVRWRPRLATGRRHRRRCLTSATLGAWA